MGIRLGQQVMWDLLTRIWRITELCISNEGVERRCYQLTLYRKSRNDYDHIVDSQVDDASGNRSVFMKAENGTHLHLRFNTCGYDKAVSSQLRAHLSRCDPSSHEWDWEKHGQCDGPIFSVRLSATY